MATPAQGKLKTVLEPHGTEVGTAAGGARHHRKPLSRFRWRDIQALLSESLNSWSRHNDGRLGASLALYTLLSLAPLVLVVVSIAGIVFGHTAAQREIVRETGALVGPAGANVIGSVLAGSKNTTHGLIATLLGLVTLLFSASGVVIELRDALNTIWEVKTPNVSGFAMVESFLKQRLFSFAIVVAIGFLLVVSLAVSTWIAALGEFSASLIPGGEVILHFVNFLISFVVIAALFAAIYKVMPDVRIEWRDVILGGAVNSLLFTVGKLLLGIYLGRASYTSLYGAAGSIVVLIVWVYYSGQIFFLGAEFTRVFACHYGSRPHEHPQEMVKLATDVAPQTESKIIKPSEIT